MALSDADIVGLWEKGRQQHPLDRALYTLLHAYPDVGWDALAALPIGRRDALLLDLREELFGPHIEAFTECPTCSERLEISLECAELRGDPQLHDERMMLELGETRVTFRLPDSRDLAVAAATGSVESARALLLQRCLIAGECCPGIDAGPLPDEVVAAIIEKMAESDPLGEIILDLECPCCRKRCRQLFDIASFLWNELSLHAKRLLRDVHMLAGAYGWTEGEILSMSATRRNLYLEMVAG